MKKEDLTLSVARRLLHLLEGGKVIYSNFPYFLGVELAEEGILTAASRRGSFRLLNAQGLRMFLAQNYDIQDLEQWIEVKTRETEVSRSEQVTRAGNSKLRKSHVFKGFLVNSYAPIHATLQEETFVISPPLGTSFFIEDYEHFRIPSEVVVVGMENSENFQQIRKLQYLFPNLQVLFVSRYPYSADLRTWLQSIPNRYIHFGHFDLAGINIFLNEFYTHLGVRAEFFIPEDIEQRLQSGNRLLYEKQCRYRLMNVSDERLKRLIEMIHHYRRGYEQEGYIR